MHKIKNTAPKKWLLACLFACLPLAVLAAPAPDDRAPPPRQKLQLMDEDSLQVPAFMRDLNLSEMQRDGVFEILHEQMPIARKRKKAIRLAEEELRKLSVSNRYEEAKVRALAERLAIEVMELSMLQTHTSQNLYSLLDQSQRRQVAEMEARAALEDSRKKGTELPPPAQKPAPH